MRSTAERHLVLLVVAVSLALTGLTVWAVARQSRALQTRERAALRSSAETAAARRTAILHADVRHLFDAARRAWESGRLDEFDVWSTRQTDWLLTCCSVDGGPWRICPRTPLEEPTPDAAAEVGSPDDNTLLARLRNIQRLATDPDPLTRATALLAMAAYEQQLGHPLAASRILGDAAQLFRSTPPLARFAFRADLNRIDTLLDAGDHDRARAAYALLLETLLKGHPARLGLEETAALNRQRDALGLDDYDPLTSDLEELNRRARQRQAIAAATASVLAGEGTSRQAPIGPTSFLAGTSSSSDPFVVVVFAGTSGPRFALVATASQLLVRWRDPGASEPGWQVRLPDDHAAALPLIELGPEFANAVLDPSPAAATRLQNLARRQLAVLLAAAAGSIGAWALVIWMMVRVVARQRELAHLQSRFVADVSHELKTPLALIRLLAETLADRRIRDPERMQAYHETITKESERLTVLLDNILDMGRIESGRKQYEFGQCDIADVARQAWTLFEPQFAEEDFDAHLEIADGLPTIHADEQALQQVLVNLLQNAHRYCGDRKFVRLSVAREGYLIVLVVDDHGIGMNRGELHRLGESFFRADDTRVRQTRGAGLGLAIINHIVTAHGGKIEIHSRAGEGSKFTVWIPFEPRDED